MDKKEFISISLPYGLKMFGIAMCEDVDSKDHVIEIGSIDFTGCVRNKNRNSIMAIPILRPLSDLTKPIEHNGETFLPIEKCFSLYRERPIIHIYKGVLNKDSFIVINQLIEWHFDIAGLIEKGEAVDVNTLPDNPYK